MKTNPPLAGCEDDGYVGEEVVVLRRRHRFLQRCAVLEVTYQDAKAVQVWVLWGDNFKNGL